MVDKNHEKPQTDDAPTKVEYIRKDGQSYWLMSDGTTQEARPLRVPLEETITRPPQPGMPISPLLEGAVDHAAFADSIEKSAEILRSGELGTGDRSERLARVMDESAEIERAAAVNQRRATEQRQDNI